MPQITVLMTAYNSECFIGKSIESILSQSFEDFELLIINDGSTDNTINIIKRYKDPRIRLIENKKNMGLSFSRNIALEHANGEFMAVLDSDDIAFPKRLEIQLQYFLDDPELALLGSCAYIINDQGSRTGEKMIIPCESNHIHATLLFNNSFIHSTIMMRMSSFREFGGYPSYSIAEDYGLFANIALKYKVTNINEFLIEYRIHGMNISIQKKEQFDLVLKRILSYQLSQIGLSFNDLKLEMMLSSIHNSIYSIDQYEEVYRDIIIQNRKIKQFPCTELEHIIFKNWFQIIMEKGKIKTLPLLFRFPFYDKKFTKIKHVRQAFKKSFKSFFIK